MARYRKVDVRMWRDERVRRLTSGGPNGRECWQFLLTNPHTSNIPGLYAAYPETLAAELRWSPKGFLEAFGELFREGLAKADWTAGLVLIPGAIKYNEPENPNVVKGWRATWDELPECPLKAEAYQHLKGYLEGYRKGFAEVFAKACGKGMANQEQEQEQEQDKSEPVPPVPEKARCTPGTLQDTWLSLTGKIAHHGLTDVAIMCEDAAAAQKPPADPNTYLVSAVTSFVAWVGKCPADRRPQMSPQKFVEHFARVQEMVSGRGSKPANSIAARLAAANRAERGE